MFFFKRGKQYRIITPRLDTKSAPHYFEHGVIVTCRKVVPAFTKRAHEVRRDHLAGDFVDANGVEQTLYTGDVVAL